MATRLKTIEYAWPTDPITIVSGTPYTSSTIAVYFPETGSARKIQSAWVETYIRDRSSLTTGRGSIGNRTSSLVINDTSTAFRTYTAENSSNDSGEHYGLFFLYDFTSDFQNITGSATGSTVAWSFNYEFSTVDPTFTNLSAKLFITYEYDDTLNRRVKTVTIPCDKTGSFPTSLAEIPSAGFPQVPILDSFCPESNKTFRNIWVEVVGAERGTLTTDATLSMSFDSDAATGLAFFERACGVGSSFKINFVKNDLVTSTTHSIKATSPDYGSTFFQECGVLLKVTYEYDHDSSNTILNSLEIPFLCSSPYYFPDLVTLGVFSDDILVEEPDPIDLKQSGVLSIRGSSSSGPLHYVQFTSGSLLNLFPAALSQHSSYCCNTTRTDYSGSITDARMPLKRGLNPINIKYGVGAAPQRGSSIMGYYYLNYHSGKHPLGEGVHNHTVKRIITDYTNYNTIGYTYIQANYTASIPETDYFINSYGMINHVIHNVTKTALPTFTPSLGNQDYFYVPFDTMTDAAFDITQPTICNGTERHSTEAIWADQYRKVRRYPQKIPDVLRTTGIYNFQALHTMSVYDQAYNQLVDSITYNSIMYSVTGSLSGSYSGDGSGIIVGLYRSDNRDLISTGSTGVGGTYSFTWYDNTIPVFVEAIDGTKAGRSLNGYAQ